MMDDATCPACAHKGLEYRSETIDLPYLGESLETMLRCAACGYRHTDFILTETKGALRTSFIVKDEAAMSVRVVRSSSGTVRIPELGINIEPGTASDAYISNIEGIIVRIEGVLDQLYRDSEDAKQRLAIEKMMAHFQLLRDGKGDPITVVIEDPFGNSAIVHPDVKKEELTDDEAARLQTGMFVFGPDGKLLEE